MIDLDNLKLSVGQHEVPPEVGGTEACVMELVSYLAGEPWTDHPECASKSLTCLAIAINDQGDQPHRDKLKELAPRLVSTLDVNKEPARANIYAEFAKWCCGCKADDPSHQVFFGASRAIKSAKMANKGLSVKTKVQGGLIWRLVMLLLPPIMRFCVLLNLEK